MEILYPESSFDKSLLTFFMQETEGFDTSNLVIKIKERKFSAKKEEQFGSSWGWCQCPMPGQKSKVHRISIVVNTGMEYPVEECHTTPYRTVRSAVFRSREDALAFILFHEFWHYLCNTKQRKGNYETRANVYGMEMQEKYGDWIFDRQAKKT